MAQALHDTHALSAIANSTYGVVVTDTGANVAANLAALNADANVTSILPQGGSQNLSLSVSQMVTDAHAISLLGKFGVTVVDTAADLNALTVSQIDKFAAEGVTQLQATDADVSLSAAQQTALTSTGYRSSSRPPAAAPARKSPTIETEPPAALRTATA